MYNNIFGKGRQHPPADGVNFGGSYGGDLGEKKSDRVYTINVRYSTELLYIIPSICARQVRVELEERRSI